MEIFLIMDLATFLLTISSGHPVAIYSSGGTNTVQIGEVSRDVLVTPTIDLGKYFTTNQILDSYPLRAGIDSGQIIAIAGVVTPTINQVD
jgi:hypothetical protein